MRPHHSAGPTSRVTSCLSLSTWDHSVVEPCLANLAWALPAGGCGDGGLLRGASPQKSPRVLMCPSKNFCSQTLGSPSSLEARG